MLPHDAEGEVFGGPYSIAVDIGDCGGGAKMIFKQYQQVLDGTKTQTRRPVKEGDEGVELQGSIAAVFAHRGSKLKWQVGRTYAVQPGRGKKAVGRIRIIKIRRERLKRYMRKYLLSMGRNKN